MQLYIHFLGTGGVWPSSQRNVSAIAVKRASDLLLFDCGEGTQRQLQKSALSHMQVDNVFITHFHGDHFLGLPGLFQTLQLNDREKPLHVYGPPGMKQLVQQLTHLGYCKPTYDIYGHNLQPGDEVRFDGYGITCITANHTVPAYSYCLEEDSQPGRFNKQRAHELGVSEGPLLRRLQEGYPVEVTGRTVTPDMVLEPPCRGRKITLSGDTAPYDEFIEFAWGSNALLHEATADSSLEKRANEYGHSTARQAAEIAAAANVDQLYLTHISPRYHDVSHLKREACEVFPKSTVAHDFMQVEVAL